MLSSHPVQLTDAPYSMTKTPGRALANRGENVGALPAKGKNTNGVPRTPFQPASALHHKMVKDQKPGTTVRLLADKTPLPNRIGTTLFQTPFPQKQGLKSSKIAFVDPDVLNQTKSMKNGGGKTPDSVQRPSSMRRHVKHPRSATQNFETPMNQGNHWDISDGDIVLSADMQPALQDAIVENDDFDEIEFMAPNTLDLPYQPPFDFELPDYKVLGKKLRNLAHSCPYDESPSPPEPDLVVSDIEISNWDMFKLPPLSFEDDPFHKARAELTKASGAKTSVPISKTRPETATSDGTTTRATRTTATKNTLPGPVKSTYHKSTVSLSSKPVGGVVTRVATSGGKTSVPISKARPETATTGVTTTRATRTTATKNALPGPVKSTYHKSTVSLSSRPVGGVVTRIAASTVRRPQTVIDMNKKRDIPATVHGALMLVKDLHVNGDMVGEDFLFDVCK